MDWQRPTTQLPPWEEIPSSTWTEKEWQDHLEIASNCPLYKGISSSVHTNLS